MKRYILGTLVIAGLLAYLFTGLVKGHLRYTLRLDHDMPEMAFGGIAEYKPVIEEAYLVHDHLLMTNNALPGHFPDDATVMGKGKRAFWYWVDFPYAIKAFLVEDMELPFYVKVLPVKVRLMLLPEWVRRFYPYVAEELRKDGGWENRLALFKREREAMEERWAKWEEESERRRRLYEKWLEENPPKADDFDPYGDFPFQIGRKGG